MTVLQLRTTDLTRLFDHVGSVSQHDHLSLGPVCHESISLYIFFILQLVCQHMFDFVCVLSPFQNKQCVGIQPYEIVVD